MPVGMVFPYSGDSLSIKRNGERIRVSTWVTLENVLPSEGKEPRKSTCGTITLPGLNPGAGRLAPPRVRGEICSQLLSYSLCFGPTLTR